ncbi:MAG TPA: succinate--CoA ligase subunit alpha [Candidatus Hypogeohydataceae bacterium YC38]|nr:succinate--CoA ligase subunit alpha [Candidatus Brocadiales bacterium]
MLIDRNIKVLCQGITGTAGSFHTGLMLQYGTKIVAGVSPGKGGTLHQGIPVYNCVLDAVRDTGIEASVIFVPAPYAPDAILEAAEAGIKLVVCITEGIPLLDMIKVKKYLSQRQTRLIGPNCPGIIVPGESKIGIMPGYIHTPGNVGVISRSGTLTYEVVWQLTQRNIGQSTCIGIGGDPILGTDFVDALRLFQEDVSTTAVVLIGEIGGSFEQEAARFIKESVKKPVISFVAGRNAPKGKRMGHAGAIIDRGVGSWEEKTQALKEAGVTLVDNPAEIGEVIEGVLKGSGLIKNMV